MRRRQKMFLARYARQSVLQWDDVDVTEIDAWVEECVALLRQEGVMQRATGDE